MKISVLQRSRISRYAGEFASLSAFRLSPAPTVSDCETAEVRGEGELCQEGERLSLSYREEESGVSVSLSKEGDRLSVTRGGATLEFLLGGVTAFVYRTAYGNFPTEAYTDTLSLQKQGETLLLTVCYTAAFGGMAQKNEMRFKLTP